MDNPNHFSFVNMHLLNHQNLKYIVRDNVLEYMSSITSGVTSKEEIIEIVSNHLEEFKQIAQDTVYENGFDYEVSIEIGNFEFPTKTYGDVSFPAGFYDALKIKMGNADGQNWWCVMFPPLCFIDVSSGIVDDKAKDDRWIDDGETSDIDSLDSFNYSFEFWFEQISYYLGKVA